MAIENVNGWLLRTAILAFVLSGCTAQAAEEVLWRGAAGLLISEKDMQQVRNCGPDRTSTAELDKLCGKTEISFEAASGERFPPTVLEKVEVYRIVSHNKYKGETTVTKDEKPSRPYVVVGILKIPNGVYYGVQLDKYIKDKLSEVGAHAVLEYRPYRDAVGWYDDKRTGKGFDVTKMSAEATVIRYKD